MDNSLKIIFLIFLILSPHLSFCQQLEKFDVALKSGTILKAQIKGPSLYESRQHTPLPVILVFGGFQEAAKVVTLVKTNTPVLIGGFDYPFEPERKFSFPQSLKFAPEVKKMLHETVEGISILLTEIKKRYKVDDNRITVLGASLGAPFAVLAASRDLRFNGLVIVHGFGAIPQTIAHQLLRRWSPQYQMIAKPFVLALSWLAWFYVDIESPEGAAKNLQHHQKILMITAEDDTFIPAFSRQSLWHALQTSKATPHQILMRGEHLQPGSEKLLKDLTSQVELWLKKEGLL